MNFKQLEEFLDNYLPMLGMSGSDTVIYRNHEQIFRHTTGLDNIEDGTRLKDNALYNLYSCTKPATAVAAMQLIENGEILITDPVYAYIPEFKDITVKVKREDGSLDVREAKAPMLIKHLLTMTS
ncbi:MAG: serine hydrolase, partial [Clostridia bacterium]|nr:serine hydrolase [Clostridia bacterium]